MKPFQTLRRILRKQLNRSPIRGLLLLAALAAAAPLSAQPAVSGHEQLARAVHDFIADYYVQDSAPLPGRRVEIDVAHLDPRLQIDPCPVPLTTRLNHNQVPLGKITVRVECAGEAPWSRYIPATVRVWQQILQSARPLPRGSILGPADIELAEIDVSTVRNTWLAEPERALGKELRRAMQAGQPITAEALTQPQLIARGDTVVLTAQRGSARIRHQGVALQNGEMGSQISVRNTSSKRVVQAVVSGPGEAEVIF